VRSGAVLPERAVDLAIVGGLIAADVVAQVVVSAGGDARSPALGLGPVLVAAVCAAPFWWRRRYPISVLVAVLVLVGVAHGLVTPGLFTQHTGGPVVLSAYAVGSWAERRARAAVVGAVVLAVVFAGTAAHAKVADAAAVSLVLVALPGVAGHAARTRRLYTDEVERRLSEAERDRDLQAERAVLEERRVIARELHDVVAHHVGLIGVQAGAARTALGRSPELTEQRLLAIEQSSRSAVNEMGRLLGVLRSDGSAGELAPQPGLAMLDALVDGFRATGLAVTVDVRGAMADMPPALDLCCYRVIEEALTNAARHSAAGAVAVGIEFAGGRVQITVSDPGPARIGTSGTGRGLVGMRERVSLFGGSLRAGPDGNGGFTVEAVLSERAPG